MNISLTNIENEIIHQILFAELCFEICDLINKKPGRGPSFIPFYYNLNYTKGLISLHSLLLSTKKEELSLDNYLKKYTFNFPKENIEDFKKETKKISDSLKKIFKYPLRHKIAAHIAKDFNHTDFVSAYIMPKDIKKYLKVIYDLKKLFFNFSNHAENDKPFQKIIEESKYILGKLDKNI